MNVAGNSTLASEIHVTLGDRLVESVALGATHRTPGDESLPMPGPTPELFFIPTVSEDRAADEGFEQAHRKFADAWHAFTPWASAWIDIEPVQGIDAIEASYRRLLDAHVGPQEAILCRWD